MEALKPHQFVQQILFISDLEKITGKSRMTLRRWWTSGKFPPPIKLNGTLAWHASVIEEWMRSNFFISSSWNTVQGLVMNCI